MKISDPLLKGIAEDPWLFVPAAATLLFAGIMALLLRQKGILARRRALLIGIGTTAVLASFVFAAFVWSFISLLERGSRSFDAVWLAGALGAGALAVWLWFKFYQIARAR